VHPSLSDDADVVQLYATHAPSLYRYLAQLTGDGDIAADIVQDTFLRFITGTPTNGSLRGWLFRVATNAARDHWRVKRGRGLLLDRATPEELHIRAHDPEQDLSRREQKRAVRAALATLQERDRVALLMREEGFTHAEIAEAIGTTPKSVGTVIARALVRFADALGIGHDDL
jgi:RNA polymerase sigma factor (sigma-70 family)